MAEEKKYYGGIEGYHQTTILVLHRNGAHV